MALWNNDAGNATGFSSSDYCPEIVWIFDAIENNDQRLFTSKQNVEVGVADLTRNGDDSLMYLTACKAVENHTLFFSNRNSALVRKLEYFSYFSGLRFARDVYSFDRL